MRRRLENAVFAERLLTPHLGRGLVEHNLGSHLEGSSLIERLLTR